MADVTSFLEEAGVDCKKMHLASEDDLAGDYPDFELGAVPPFGGREDQVIVDERLAGRDSVVLEAGAHEQSVGLKAADLLRPRRVRPSPLPSRASASSARFGPSPRRA